MTDSPDRGHARRTPADERPYSPGPRGRRRRRDRAQPGRRRAAAGSCTAATGSATSSSTARTRRSRTCCGPATGIPTHRLPTAPVPDAVLTVLRALPARGQADGCAADGGLGVGRDADARLAADRRAGAGADRVLAVGAGGVRPAARRARSRSSRTRRSTSSRASSTSSPASGPDPATARALDAYFIVGAEHGFNASTFTARVITSTRSDIASAVVGRDRDDEGAAPRRRAVGGRRPAQPDRLARARRGVDPRGARPRRAADGLRPPRLPRLRPARRGAAQGRRGDGRTSPTGWQLAIAVEDVALRVLAERHPDRALKTNVEFYAAPVLQGVGLSPDLFPATFSLARHAGWTAHVLEQAADNRLIRPDVRYVGPDGARPAGEPEPSPRPTASRAAGRRTTSTSSITAIRAMIAEERLRLALARERARSSRRCSR